MDYWLRSTFPQNCWYLESTLVAVVNEEPFPGMDIVASMCLLYVGTGTLILHTFCLPLPNQVTVLKKQILSALYLAIATRTEYLKLIIPCFILWRKAKCTLSVKYLPFPIWCIIADRQQSETADALISNHPQKGRKSTMSTIVKRWSELRNVNSFTRSKILELNFTPRKARK